MIQRLTLWTAFACLLLMGACSAGTSGPSRTAQSPAVDRGLTERGEASYYADKFVGRQTASGEVYTHKKLTAAHRTLPFGTRVRVTRLDDGSQVTVRINDRGPFKRGRIIDLSKSAAERIGLVADGITRVRIEVLGGASTSGSAPEKPANRSGDTSTSW